MANQFHLRLANLKGECAKTLFVPFPKRSGRKQEGGHPQQNSATIALKITEIYETWYHNGGIPVDLKTLVIGRAASWVADSNVKAARRPVFSQFFAIIDRHTPTSSIAGSWPSSINLILMFPQCPWQYSLHSWWGKPFQVK